MQKSAAFIILYFWAFSLYAQKKLIGAYDVAYHQFVCTDANIIVEPFVEGRAAFMIKGKDPFDEKTNRVGFIDSTGKVLIKPLYTNCSNFRHGFALVRDTARRQGVIDSSGKLVIPFANQSISFCENGLFVEHLYTRNGNQISVVNNQGKTIVPFGRYLMYATAGSLYPPFITEGDDTPRSAFYWHLLYVSTVQFDKYMGVKAGNKWAVINRDGKEVIPPKFDWIGVFANGRAPASINKKFGIVDTAGNQVIPFMYDNIALADTNLAIAIQNKKLGLITLANKLLIPFKYDFINQVSPDAFLVSNGQRYSGTASFGIISKNDITIVPVKNQSIEKFGSGYLVCRNNDSTAVFDSAGTQKTAYSRGGRFNYPVWEMGDDQGYTVYNKQKNDFVHYERIDRLMYYEDNKWGLLDSAGVEVVRPQYDEYRYTYDGKAIVVKQNNKWSLIDGEGRKIIAGAFDEIEQEGNSFFIKIKRGNKYGLINKGYQLILPIKYDEISISGYDITADINVVIGGKKGIFDSQGHEVIPTKYDAIRPVDNGLRQVMIDSKWGLLNTRGNEVAPCIYDNIQLSREPLIIVTKDKLVGLINREGKIVQPTVCKAIALDVLNGKHIYIIIRNGKTGMADADGKVFLPFKYDQAYKSQQYSNRSDELIIKNNGFYGVADLNGKLLVPTLYDQVSVAQGTSGKRYEVVSGGKHGLADSSGKVLIPCLYNYLAPRDKSIVASKNEAPGFGVIGWDNQVIVPFIYQSVENGSYGYIVTLNSKRGVLDLNGKEVIPIVYDYISGYFQNVFFLTKDHKTGIADYTGKIILPLIYDNLSVCGKETIQITKDKLTGLIDYRGKVIYPCKYTFINCVDGKVVEIY